MTIASAGHQPVKGPTNVARFADHLGVPVDELRQWAVGHPDEFWGEVSRRHGPSWSTAYESVRGSVSTGPEAWFPGGRLNIAAWALGERHPGASPALRWLREDGLSEQLNRDDLRNAASEICHRLRGLGVGPGSRVGLVATAHWTGSAAVLGILATGAACLPLFSGYGGVALRDRVAASGPDLLLVQDVTVRKGHDQDIAVGVREALSVLPGLAVVTLATRAADPATSNDAHMVWSARDLLDSSAEWTPRAVPSGAPAVILFTSGSTGPAKGVVLSHAGYGHQLASEWTFHLDVRHGDRVLWPADPGWIVGSFTLLGALAGGAELTLLDGNPLATLASHSRHAGLSDVTILGGSPSFLSAVTSHSDAHGISPRLVAAAGEPFSSEAWTSVQERFARSRPPIINMCGGTEVGTSLLATLPTDEPPATGFGGPALGVDADVVDAEGTSISDSLGILVARNSWPGRAIEIFNHAEGVSGYFTRFGDGVWSQEDLALRSATGWFVHGRSDEVLKIAGRRVGPAEIENAAVTAPGALGCVAIDATVDGHGILLVVVDAMPGLDNNALAAAVSAAIETAMGTPFRPLWTGASADLPRTTTGKLDRRAVRSQVRATLGASTEPAAVATLRAWLDATRSGQDNS